MVWRVGNKVESYLNQYRWSQKTLARKANVSIDTISRIVNGRTLPRLDSFYRICKALRVRPEALAGLPEDY